MGPAVLARHASLPGIKTQSALPTPGGWRCYSPIIRASFTNPSWMARAGPSRSIGPLPGGNMGSLQESINGDRVDIPVMLAIEGVVSFARSDLKAWPVLPSGQEFLRLDLGAVVSGGLVMAPAAQRESQGLSPSAAGRPEDGDGAPNGAPPDGVAVRAWVSGTDVTEQMDGEVRGVHLRKGRAGARPGWPGASVFARGLGPVYGTTGPSTPAFTGTQAWGTAFGDPPVGQGDPGVKPGALLSGLPAFLRSRREDHGLNGYVWVVWVVGPESPGLTGGRFALGSSAKGQGGDGAPPRGRRPAVVDGRTWVSGTGVKKQAGLGSARSSSANEGKLAPERWDQVPGRGESGTE